MNTNKILTTILTLFIAFNLTACGFKLRSQATLPEEVQTLYLTTDNPYGQFETSLKQSLLASGVTLVDSPKQAPLILNISKPTQGVRNTTTGNSNETRVYNISYSVRFALKNSRGKPLLPPQDVRTTRSLTLSANQLLESNNQLTLLTREMQREVINKILDRLGSRQVSEICAR